MRGNAEQVRVYERAAGENVNVPPHCVFVHFVPLSVWRLTSYQSSARAVLGNICPRLWQYGAKKARSVLKQPRGTFLNTARASEVDEWFIIWHSDETCLFWICQLSRTKIHGLWFFRGNSPYGKIPTKSKPLGTFGLTLGLPCHAIKTNQLLFTFELISRRKLISGLFRELRTFTFVPKRILGRHMVGVRHLFNSRVRPRTGNFCLAHCQVKEIVTFIDRLSFVACRYGDKTPRSFVAKWLAMVWMIAGCVVFSLLSSCLIAGLTVTTVDNSNIKLYGLKVRNY